VLRHRRPLARGALVCVLAVAASMAPAPAAPGARHCAVPEREAVCSSFAVFLRAGRRDDRLPRLFRDDPPLKQVDHSSSRRLRHRTPKGYSFFALAGKRLVCIVSYVRKQGQGSFACNPLGVTVRGKLFLEEACAPAPRRHRVLLFELVPDGVRTATVLRAGRAPVKRAVRDNLVVADLPVRSRRDLPKAVVWRRAGRRHRLGLVLDESLVTCRSRSARGLVRASG
jgi:hypothetical protein